MHEDATCNDLREIITQAINEIRNHNTSNQRNKAGTRRKFQPCQN